MLRYPTLIKGYARSSKRYPKSCESIQRRKLDEKYMQELRIDMQELRIDMQDLYRYMKVR
jgi:hypothetical protein